MQEVELIAGSVVTSTPARLGPDLVLVGVADATTPVGGVAVLQLDTDLYPCPLRDVYSCCGQISFPRCSNVTAGGGAVPIRLQIRRSARSNAGRW